MSEELLQAWRERLALRPVELDSGYTVMIGPVSMEALEGRGPIPLLIFTETQAAAGKRRRKGATGIDEDFLKMLPSVNAVVMAAAAVPQVAEEEDLENGVVSIHSLSLLERLRLFEEASGAANALRPFRGEPAGDENPSPDGDDVPQTAE